MADIFNLSPKNNRSQSPHSIGSQYADGILSSNEELDRFTRDFAAVDKSRREREMEKKMMSYEERRRERVLEE